MPLALTTEERRRRRFSLRSEGRSLMDDSVASPCVSICKIDKTTNLCLGCSRSVGEITDWCLLTAEEKRGVAAELPARDPGQRFAEKGTA
ncbi:DUF1289 domain-containing protein [Algihabitans albus]|uniref:DUF1289 domain-containing protein n=1 Tax=Algihabitans albus TaxID=2164067 RepID=UPI001F3783B7|nr:DUF1289 domain-containing protein [Algihabitans albus]